MTGTEGEYGWTLTVRPIVGAVIFGHCATCGRDQQRRRFVDGPYGV